MQRQPKKATALWSYYRRTSVMRAHCFTSAFIQMAGDRPEVVSREEVNDCDEVVVRKIYII
jgi:hypothetical protein